jgi:N-acetylglucosaminyldiphosphoundecaprenol N-acetyl-beta-D-mannosaminyltransferase
VFCVFKFKPMPDPSSKIVQLFGVRFNAVNFADAVDLLTTSVQQRPSKVVVTPNVDHLVLLSELPDFKSVYTGADFAFADGMPVVWASRLLGRPLPERVTGADLFVALCRQGQQLQWKVCILGGIPGQEPMLRDRFSIVFPGLRVELRCPGMGFDYQSSEADAAADWINENSPDLVFVCLGFPRQCLWSFRNRPKLDTGLILCVGASMEFALGLKSRAPQWMQRTGFEWLWRLGSEPGKLWRRYLFRGPRFLQLAWSEWRTARSAP